VKKPRVRSLGKLADAAFRQVAEIVIKRAEDAGTPVIIWENGQVTKVEPSEMRKRLQRKKKRKQGKP
jgi:hypothetical protein